MTDVISGVIDQRIEGTGDRHQHTEDQSEEYGEKDHPESIILCLFDLAASQYLTDKNAIATKATIITLYIVASICIAATASRLLYE